MIMLNSALFLLFGLVFTHTLSVHSLFIGKCYYSSASYSVQRVYAWCSISVYKLLSKKYIIVHLAYFHTELDPTNLTVQQYDRTQVRVSWILPQNASRRGYRISTSRDFDFGVAVPAGVNVRLVRQAPGRVNYWLISIETPEIVVGPVIGIVRGEGI